MRDPLPLPEVPDYERAARSLIEAGKTDTGTSALDRANTALQATGAIANAGAALAPLAGDAVRGLVPIAGQALMLGGRAALGTARLGGTLTSPAIRGGSERDEQSDAGWFACIAPRPRPPRTEWNQHCARPRALHASTSTSRIKSTLLINGEFRESFRGARGAIDTRFEFQIRARKQLFFGKQQTFFFISKAATSSAQRTTKECCASV